MELIAVVPVSLAFGAGIVIGAGLQHWLASMQPQAEDEERSRRS